MYPITTQCRVLEVSPSGFYAWLTRTPSKHSQDDILLGDRIEAIHRRSRSTYGRPRGPRREALLLVSHAGELATARCGDPRSRIVSARIELVVP